MTLLRRAWRTGAGRSLLLAAGLAVYYGAAIFLMRRTGIGCVFVHFFGIPCPGCGMTRALGCLLRLDFVGAFRYHPLVFAMPYVFAYVIFPVEGRIHRRILTVIGLIAAVNWVFRILCVTI